MADAQATAQANKLDYLDDQYLVSLGRLTKLIPYPFAPSGACSETPAEFGLFEIDKDILQYFQEATIVDDILVAQSCMNLGRDSGLEAFIFSKFIAYFGLCNPTLLEDTISYTSPWIELTSVDNEDRPRRLRIRKLLQQRYDRLRDSACMHWIHENHYLNYLSRYTEKSPFMQSCQQLMKLALYDRRIERDPDRSPLWFMSAAMSQFCEAPATKVRTVKTIMAILEDTEDSERVDWVRTLDLLNTDLGTAYLHTGTEEFFGAAVGLRHWMINKMSQNPSKQVNYRVDLMNIHEIRSCRTGSSKDLDMAIENAEVLSKLEDHTESLLFRSYLGKLYGRRFLRNQKRCCDDKDQGIEHTRVTTDEVQSIADKRLRPDFEHKLYRNHGWLLYLSFLENRSQATLDDSVSYYQYAIQTMRSRSLRWHASRHLDFYVEEIPYLVELGTVLTLRFMNRTPSLRDDITEALEAIHTAFQRSSGRGYIAPPEVITALRNAYLAEWAETPRPSAEQTFALADQVASYCEVSWQCTTADLNARTILAQFGAELWAAMGDYEKALALSEAATRMSPDLSPWTVAMADRQYFLADHSRLSSLASSLALHTGREHFQALFLLEIGRGIMSGQILDIRADLSLLKEKRPNIALRFDSLRQELEASTKISARLQGELVGMSEMRDAQMQRQHEVESQFRALQIHIRMIPGFENFFLWPPENEMREAAKHGPIVVLSSSSLRTDAFIIQSTTGVRAIELTDVSDIDIGEMGQEMKRYAASPTFDISPLLGRMWDTIAKPVMEVLGFDKPVVNDRWPHMWWVLAGAFSHLPLHAAGYHRPGSVDSVIDRVISSYAPTVKALVHWRRQKPPSNSAGGAHRALLVAMPNTPSQKALPAVNEEVLMLEKLWPLLGLDVEALSQSQARKEEVVSRLKQCKIFHFAGHGHADQIDPSRSQLLLKDWQHNALTVNDLRDNKLQDDPPFLAFLSACSTGANEVDTLVDEGIHLAGALQLAGFRHVVGTMWEVSDSLCVNVAKVFYEMLLANRMTDESVALCLHKSIRRVRQSYLESVPTENYFIPKHPRTQGKVLTKEEAVGELLRSTYQAQKVAMKSQIGGIPVLVDSRSSRKPLSCTVGPVEGPTARRVHWIPYVHFGV